MKVIKNNCRFRFLDFITCVHDMVMSNVVRMHSVEGATRVQHTAGPIQKKVKILKDAISYI